MRKNNRSRNLSLAVAVLSSILLQLSGCSKAPTQNDVAQIQPKAEEQKQPATENLKQEPEAINVLLRMIAAKKDEKKPKADWRTEIKAGDEVLVLPTYFATDLNSYKVLDQVNRKAGGQRDALLVALNKLVDNKKVIEIDGKTDPLATIVEVDHKDGYAKIIIQTGDLAQKIGYVEIRAIGQTEKMLDWRAGLKLGDTVVVEVGFFAVDLPAYLDFVKRHKANDEIGVDEMLRTKKLLIVKKGTTAKITDISYSVQKGGHARIRLQTGEYATKEGYINVDELGLPK